MEKDINGRFIKKYSCNEKYFDIINNENSFLLGLLASDGNVKNNKVFSIYQSSDHGYSLIKKIKNWLSYNGKIYKNNTTHEISYGIVITSNSIIKKLREHNITENKTFTYEYNGLADLKYFLQGYLEGDGCIGIYDSSTTKYFYVSFVGNEKFKDSIIRHLPIKPNIRELKNSIYEIKYLGQKGIEFSDWLWGDEVVYDKSLKYQKYIQFRKKYLENTRYFKYRKLNSKIEKYLNKGLTPKLISEKLNISKKTIYNYKYNKKNGRNTY